MASVEKVPMLAEGYEKLSTQLTALSVPARKARTSLPARVRRAFGSTTSTAIDRPRIDAVLRSSG